jgi:hypothetical protein
MRLEGVLEAASLGGSTALVTGVSVLTRGGSISQRALT